MSEMIKAYQEINKRRQSDDMDVNSLTMFAEAWNHQQAKIDELQTQYDELNNRATGIALDQMTTAKLNYELQGRIDEALLKLTEKKIMYVDIVAETINILKGDKDEN